MILPPRRDERVVPYATTGAALAAVGLLWAQPILVVCAAPFIVAVVLGLRHRSPLELSMTFDADTTTPLEGDLVTCRIVVDNPPRVATTVRVVPSPGWTLVDPPSGVLTLRPDGANMRTTRGTISLRARRWGRLTVGSLDVQCRSLFGLVTWNVLVQPDWDFRVLPPPERVRELLPPPVSRTFVGQHESRSVGDGFDFAELRPLSAGDRLRDINWPATARTGTTQVNRRHPERDGDVLIVLDTSNDSFGQLSGSHHEALSRTARAAWSIGKLHLNSHDRVGLLSRGRVRRELDVRGGDHARYTLLETLLDISGEIAEGIESDGPRDRQPIPFTSLVIMLTPLTTSRSMLEALSLHRSGHSVAVVVVEMSDLIPAPTDDADVTAQRLYRIHLATLRDELIGDGVPLAVWTAESSLGNVVQALAHQRRAHMVRR